MTHERLNERQTFHRGYSTLTWHECAIWAFVLSAILVATFNGFFFGNEILVPSDLMNTMTPWKDQLSEDDRRPLNKLMYDPIMAFRPDFLRVQEAFREGHWPLWNNMELGGLPLLANCQSAVFYPLHLLLFVMDVDTAVSLFVVIKLWIAAFVAYICARLLGFAVWPSRWFSLVWGLGCFTHLWAYWPITDVLAWVPLVFLGTEWLADGRWRKGFFALALGGTLLLLAGHPETAFAVNVYIALYFAVRIGFAWRAGLSLWRPAGLYAGAWALALAAYAVQLVPFAEYVANCASVEQRIQMPLTGSALTSLWVPRFFGTNAELNFWDKNVHNSNLTIQQYMGIASWLGIAFVLTQLIRYSPALDKRARGRVIALLVATLVSFAMAMDMNTLAWTRALPGFSHMRTIYNVYFALFAIPLLGLIGIDLWFSRPRRVRELTAILLAIVPATMLVAYMYWYNAALIRMSGNSSYVKLELATAAGFTGLLVIVLALHCFTKRTAFVWAFLAAISLCDVYWPVRGMNPSLPRDGSFPMTPLIEFMQDRPKPIRFDVFCAAISPGTVGNFGIEECDGYDGIYPRRPMQFREELAREIWEKLHAINGVDYYVNDPRYEEPLPLSKLVERGALVHELDIENLEVYRHAAMLPRARLVANLETVANTSALFERMLEDSFDPATTAITEQPPAGAVPTNQAVPVGHATISEHRPERIVIKCSATSDAVLVLAENYYPGWKATIDGNPAPVYPVYYCFRGVTVPKGEHVVELRYRPLSLSIGLWTSILALIASGAVALRSTNASTPPGRLQLRGACRSDSDCRRR